MVAIVIGIGVLGVDFTNLAIVLGALSVGIGLGLQNIANNVISGVIMLVERPVKAGDWVSVAGHEGFIRRINIRATEMETFQRTHVIMPNSMFLQNPVVNRTYADTSSRVEIKLTVGLGTDVAVMETLLREAALGHPRVLRVPAPIVRFIQITPTFGLLLSLIVILLCRQALGAEALDYDDALRRSAHYIVSNALQPVRTATTVRVVHDKVLVTDGPFAETKEQLGGFILIEAENLDDAIQVASKIPPARFGCIEVRPVAEIRRL